MLQTNTIIILLQVGEAKYCDNHVCLSVCEHISKTTHPIFAKLFMRVTYVCDLILLCWRYDMLCTFDFMDDVIFALSGPCVGLQCFDAVGWVAGRASGL